MKKFNTILAALAAFLTINSASAQNKDSTKVSGLIDNTTTNKNMFFGMNFGNKIMNQSCIEIGKGNSKDKIAFNAWDNYDTKDSKIIEVDQTLMYSHVFKIDSTSSLKIQPSAAYYTFPGSSMSDCQELYVQTEYSGKVNAKVKAGKIFGKDSGKGFMIYLGASKTFNITDKLTTTLGAGTVYNSKYVSDATGISHIDATVSASYTIKNLSINASYTQQKAVSKDFEGIVKSEGYGKVGLTYCF